MNGLLEKKLKEKLQNMPLLEIENYINKAKEVETKLLLGEPCSFNGRKFLGSSKEGNSKNKRIMLHQAKLIKELLLYLNWIKRND